ncbi:MAG: iron-containing alcohol dehydrogenase [Verrucomicrobiales bacterium]|nr:iron-containing alcohol dehydrogenase [Verrucomicrobiales bacterium]
MSKSENPTPVQQDGTSILSSFDYQPRTRLVCGVGCIERVGELTRELGCKKVLLVTDSGIVAAGHADRVRKILDAAHIGTVLFDKVRENPTTRDVDACLQMAKESGIDAFIGLGGGSSMDTAKGCNFLLTNGGRMQDYWGVGKATKPMLPFIAIPTTAGTGSECQSAALIADEETHQKMACLDPKAAARIALLDPTLTLSQPAQVAASTGIDAIAHAVETAVTKKRTPLSLMYSHEAFKLCFSGFPTIFQTPTDIQARGQMQLGAALAGTAIENSMLGAAHSAANPLTAHFGIVHGQAVGIMLPHVVRFNAEDPVARAGYIDLAIAAKLGGPQESAEDLLRKLVGTLENFLIVANIPRSLDALGVKHSKIPSLAEEAAKQWTATFNPRPITAADFVKLYEAASKQ